MNIVFSSSDLYSKLALVTIKSLLMNNIDIDTITIYYLGDRITDESKNNLMELVRSYSREIVFLDLPECFQNFKGSNRNGQTVFAYCFFQDILPNIVDRVLLLEPDAIVMGSLKEIYETNIDEYYIAAADDFQSKWYKRKLGMRDVSPYVNCGIVLYNLKKWREDNMTGKVTNILNERTHMFFYDVQDVINCLVEGYVKILPPRFNSTTAIFLFDYKNMRRYRKPSTICTEDEFQQGKNNPIVVHFTKNQIIQSRPWIEGCQHPYKDYYLEIKAQTKQANEPLWRYNPKKLNNLAFKMYVVLPKNITATVLGIVHSFLYPMFLYKFLFRDR